MNVLGGKGLYISFTIAPLKRRRRPCSDIFCKSTCETIRSDYLKGGTIVSGSPECHSSV